MSPLPPPLTLSHVFYLIGALFVGTAVLNAIDRRRRAAGGGAPDGVAGEAGDRPRGIDRRWAQAAFWGILSAPCLFGDQIVAATQAGTQWPAQLMGAGVIALAVLATISRARPVVDDPAQTAAREALAKQFGGRLFAPVLAIPVLVALLVLGARIPGSPVPRLLEPKQLALISLGVAAAIALVAALAVAKANPTQGLTEGRRLLDTIGWPVVLPIMLATLGAVFVDTGVGKAIAALVEAVIPTNSALACLLAFGLGMVAFTALMGNAFAAFPVMMSGIGLPLLVKHHGAHPAMLGAMGMLTGYCGTLVTPMAANYNIVPVLLLELRDSHAVIRAQWPTALTLLVTNLILMSLLVFR